jgi:ATP-dependent Lhr-like helicase
VVAEQLLHRWGVAFRDLALHDSLRLPWREVQWALRQLEDRASCGAGASSRASPASSTRCRLRPSSWPTCASCPGRAGGVFVNATDPPNLVGVIVPGDTVPAVRTNVVTYVDGLPLASGAGAADVAKANGVDVADDTAPEGPDGPEAFDVLVRAMSTGRELR